VIRANDDVIIDEQQNLKPCTSRAPVSRRGCAAAMLGFDRESHAIGLHGLEGSRCIPFALIVNDY
jgi:hypothetical protein